MPHSTNTIRLFNEHIYVIGDLHLETVLAQMPFPWVTLLPNEIE